MDNHKVIVDTSVLIAASLNHVCKEVNGAVIKDYFYNISEPLFNYFLKNISKQKGIVTQEIESSAKSKVIDIFIRKLSKETNISPEQIRKDISNYSLSLILLNESLNKNLNALLRVPVDEKEISNISMRIWKFYDDIIKKLPINDPSYTIKRRVRRMPSQFRFFERKFAKQDEASNFEVYRKLKKKLLQSPPDRNDIRILSQAVYLNEKKIFPKYKICIASTDHHFSKVRESDGSLTTHIPDLIDERLHILCEWPDKILEIISKDLD